MSCDSLAKRSVSVHKSGSADATQCERQPFGFDYNFFIALSSHSHFIGQLNENKILECRIQMLEQKKCIDNTHILRTNILHECTLVCNWVRGFLVYACTLIQIKLRILHEFIHNHQIVPSFFLYVQSYLSNNSNAVRCIICSFVILRSSLFLFLVNSCDWEKFQYLFPKSNYVGRMTGSFQWDNMNSLSIITIDFEMKTNKKTINKYWGRTQFIIMTSQFRLWTEIVMVKQKFQFPRLDFLSIFTDFFVYTHICVACNRWSH